MEDKIYDIIIVGAGPAGMTAAIYAGRAGKSVCIIDKCGFGGNISNSPRVENIPGFNGGISGADFSNNLYTQMIESSDSINHIIAEVTLINYCKGLYKVYTDDGVMHCGLSVILAVGTEHKKLNLNTKDIYYCVTCDGPMFKKKDVIVVGSGNTGATYALELATYCRKVYICDITKDMCCESVLKNKIETTENIIWLPYTTIKDIKNNKENKLTGIYLNSGELVKVSAIFAAIGQRPETKFLENLVEIDQNGFIVSTNCTIDSLAGLFVAGDCRQSDFKQVTTACADGSVAAMKVIKFINNIKK